MVFLGAFQYVTLFVYSTSLFTNLRVGSLRRLIRFITYSMQMTQSRAFIHPWRRLYEWHFLCSYLLNPCVDAKYVIFCGFCVPFSLKNTTGKQKTFRLPQFATLRRLFLRLFQLVWHGCSTGFRTRSPGVLHDLPALLAPLMRRGEIVALNLVVKQRCCSVQGKNEGESILRKPRSLAPVNISYA